MATTNVGKPFGVVTSKTQATAITESKQDANSGQFYITRTNNSNTGGAGNTEGNASEAISLTINGNVLRGISKDDAVKLAGLSANTGDNINNLIVGSGLTKTGNAIDLNLGSGLQTTEDRRLEVKTSGEIIINENNYVTLDVNKLSGTKKDINKFYYSKGGIYFANTIKSGQKTDSVTESGTFQNPLDYIRLRCGTGLAFQEGYEDIGIESSSILGHDGKYYVNIDEKTIVANSSGQLSVKIDNDTIVKDVNGALSLNKKNRYSIPSIDPDTSRLTIDMSTAALLKSNSTGGGDLVIDFQRFKFLVKLALGMS